MFKALFNVIFNLVASIVQIIMIPVNAIISGALPDLTSKLSFITDNVGTIYNSIEWFFNILPPVTKSIIIFSIELLIAKYTIYIGTHAVIKIWNLIQKLKFW